MQGKYHNPTDYQNKKESRNPPRQSCFQVS